MIIGTKNKAKLEEWSSFLSKLLEVEGVSDDLEEPQETGQTIKENARIKAIFYAKKLNSFVLSDDGGFEIDALGGFPGVKSKRIYQDEKEGSDAQIQQFILKKMKDITDEQRTARQKTAIAISDPLGNIIYEDEESLDGIVLKKLGPIVIKGYPYRSLLFLPTSGKTYAEFSDQDHQKFNHKKKMSRRLIKFLKENHVRH